MDKTTSLLKVLGLSAPPIALGFPDGPPAGLERSPGGAHWSRMLSSLAEIGRANSAMQQHYRNHQAQFATA